MINFSTKYNRTEFVRFLQNDFLPEADFLPENLLLLSKIGCNSL